MFQILRCNPNGNHIWGSEGLIYVGWSYMFCHVSVELCYVYCCNFSSLYFFFLFNYLSSYNVCLSHCQGFERIIEYMKNLDQISMTEVA